MANRYANLVGSNKIKDEWQKINQGFDAVQADIDAKPDASFAQVNDIAASADDTLTIEGGTGIEVTTIPAEKKVRIVATGTSTPGPHAIEHITGGTDVIPDATTSSSGLMSAADKQELGDLRLDLTAHEASKAPHIIPSVRVRNSANISIPNNSDTVLSFDTEQWDTDNMFDPANPTRLTARTAGKYLVVGNVMFSANNTGVRGMFFRKNGSGTLNFASVRQLPVPSIDTAVFCAGVIDLAVNDYVEMIVFQNSGTSLNVGVTANFSPVFSMVRVGS